MSCEGVVREVLERKKIMQNMKGGNERGSVVCVCWSERVKGDEESGGQEGEMRMFC